MAPALADELDVAIAIYCRRVSNSSGRRLLRESHAAARGIAQSPKSGRKLSHHARRTARRAADAKAIADGAVAAVLDAEEVAAFFSSPPGVAELVGFITRILASLGEVAIHIKPLVSQLEIVLGDAAKEAGWSIHCLFSRLLVPALVSLGSGPARTRSFGVLVATIKSMWSPEDWPDKDPVRAASLCALVSNHFLEGQNTTTGVWLLSRLGLHCFTEFEDLFGVIRDSIQTLRIFCDQESRQVQRRVIEDLIALARSTRDRQARRRHFASAADLINRFGFDKTEFPELARHKLKCWLCYIVHRVPLHIVDDYVCGDPDLLALCVQQFWRAGTWTSAASLYDKYSSALDGTLDPDMELKLKGALSTLTVGPIADAFHPHNPDALTLALPEDAVIWVDTSESIARVEAEMRKFPVVGIDLEWSGRGDWLEPSLALMQLATTTQVFLVDLAEGSLQAEVGSLLAALLGQDGPLLLGFSFHNDLHELKRSPWSAACRSVHGLCDLQLLGAGPHEGLASLVQRHLKVPFCKGEQRSYWHRRPLRAAQRHYAALDALVLLQLASVIVDVPLTKPALMATALCEAIMPTNASFNSFSR
mmetsp:Transcript_111899/g.316189  ORF Transcript_111899/g.316189 Transcript_111899/m.316189 type:complete len:591 (-) Transcript_111899:95-1867(-)|eukprot:CAMPEP_0117474238 /NCGR_PEP_ID=MMETSP0784-20121206/9182_1 /TAXON_ID=39447 /ORGANISM="" /LENGTH=590 /DNA_ID=CAMNT_0005268459 /DNA_START=86 /DNA_END=1858 /DNA_ORIENTATION=+